MFTYRVFDRLIWYMIAVRLQHNGICQAFQDLVAGFCQGQGSITFVLLIFYP